jgi:hypothetical protein
MAVFFELRFIRSSRVVIPRSRGTNAPSAAREDATELSTGASESAMTMEPGENATGIRQVIQFAVMFRNTCDGERLLRDNPAVCA